MLLEFRVSAACIWELRHRFTFLALRTQLVGILVEYINQRINGPVNAHLISWPSKAQNIQNLENIK